LTRLTDKFIIYFSNSRKRTDEEGPPTVDLDAQALLGVLSTPGGLGEADFRVTTAGLLNMLGDGVVSAGDYASVQSAFGDTGDTGDTGTGIIGDANGDGVVSAGDYASAQANFWQRGSTRRSSSGTGIYVHFITWYRCFDQKT